MRTLDVITRDEDTARTILSMFLPPGRRADRESVRPIVQFLMEARESGYQQGYARAVKDAAGAVSKERWRKGHMEITERALVRAEDGVKKLKPYA